MQISAKPKKQKTPTSMSHYDVPKGAAKTPNTGMMSNDKFFQSGNNGSNQEFFQSLGGT